MLGRASHFSHGMRLVWSARIFSWRTSNDPRYNNNIVAPDVRLRDAILEGGNVIAKGCYLQGKISIGYGSALSRNCTLQGGRIIIGRYAQLGPEVSVYAQDHPKTHLTTCVHRDLFSGRLKSHLQKHVIRIGNDTWIGCKAVLLDNATVGDGAVIGAGSVVLHDVPPYTLAVGNPARVVRKRFSDEIIELLLKLRWWDLPPSRLDTFEKLFHVDIVQSPDTFKEALTRLCGRRDAIRDNPAR